MSHVDGCPACKFIVGLHRQFAQKEGKVTIFDAESVNLRHFNPHKISYPPKNLYTEAIQVTRENIGQLALEFQVELRYSGVGMEPYFTFEAHRGVENDPVATILLRVDPNVWLVALWDELHVYADYDIRNTFTFENPEAVPITGLPDKHGSMSSFQVPREDVEKTTIGSLPVYIDDKHGDQSWTMARRPENEPPAMDLMEAAKGSPRPELRALAEKLSRPTPARWNPKVDDRVEILKNGYRGIVTAVSVEVDGYRERDDILEVLHESGVYSYHGPEELRAINTDD